MKKIAVLLNERERHSEGLRVAAGLSLMEDEVDVYLIDVDFNLEDLSAIENHLEMMKAVGIKLYANFKKEGFGLISAAGIGRKFAEYDYIIHY